MEENQDIEVQNTAAKNSGSTKDSEKNKISTMKRGDYMIHVYVE